MTNYPAIIMFFIFVFATLMITYWAAKKTKSRSHFYAAGGKITSLQNLINPSSGPNHSKQTLDPARTGKEEKENDYFKRTGGHPQTWLPHRHRSTREATWRGNRRRNRGPRHLPTSL